MPLREKIERWKNYPNALGSESQAAIIVGEVAAALEEDIPTAVNDALRILSLRGTMRDIASAIQHHQEHVPHPDVPPFHDVVNFGAAACGISWGEALAIMGNHEYNALLYHTRGDDGELLRLEAEYCSHGDTVHYTNPPKLFESWLINHSKHPTIKSVLSIKYRVLWVRTKTKYPHVFYL